MSDDRKIAQAIQVYKTLCSAIENRNWKYEKDDERLIVQFRVSGDDIPMSFILIADIAHQAIRLLSPLPFKAQDDKFMDMVLATCIANFGMADGNFIFNIGDGTICYKLTASFRESLIGEELLHYMISRSCYVVDEYNDRFLALNKGYMKMEDFYNSVRKGNDD